MTVAAALQLSSSTKYIIPFMRPKQRWLQTQRHTTHLHPNSPGRFCRLIVQVGSSAWFHRLKFFLAKTWIATRMIQWAFLFELKQPNHASREAGSQLLLRERIDWKAFLFRHKMINLFFHQLASPCLDLNRWMRRRGREERREWWESRSWIEWTCCFNHSITCEL